MKLGRLIAILTILLQKDRISATSLAEKFGVSVRTIYRDIEALESAGIPIVTHTGVNGGISIVEQYKIDKKLFTDDDITMLLTGLQSVSGTLSDAKLNQTLEKIRSLIPKEHERAIELTSKQLYIDMTPWLGNPVVTNTFALLKRAMEEGVLVRFDYTGRHNTASQVRTVEPHQLMLKENSWYLRAYCRDKLDFRTFKLNRIRDMEMIQEHFQPREFESSVADFKDWTNDRVITVELIIDESLRERALDFCREETMTDMEDGRIHISLSFVESDMGYGVLLSMGHLCEVIAPAHVRQELQRRIRLLSDVYKNSAGLER